MTEARAPADEVCACADVPTSSTGQGIAAANVLSGPAGAIARPADTTVVVADEANARAKWIAPAAETMVPAADQAFAGANHRFDVADSALAV